MLRSIGNLTGLVLTRNPVGSSWEFNAPPCATHTGLIGWVMRERGVDGDFVGIISFSEMFWYSLISAFEAECRANQLTWSVVDEATFAATSWFATDS